MTDGTDTDDVFDGEDEIAPMGPTPLKSTESDGSARVVYKFLALPLVVTLTALSPVALWLFMDFETAVVAGLTAIIFLLGLQAVEDG